MSKDNENSNLMSWSELQGEKWDSLLLGNGFSINIWHGFSYASLFEVAQSQAIGSPLNQGSLALFEKLKTKNFEDVLRALYYARTVVAQVEVANDNKIAEQVCGLYANTKHALAAAVNQSHAPPGFDGLAAINSALRGFANIFTTNYDLIPYWAIMRSSEGFKDYFWKSHLFDPNDTSVRPDSCSIMYLHGALHLVELPDGKTKKLVANGGKTLQDLFDLSHPEHFPLFVAEGRGNEKLARIRRNDYLRFVFENFKSMSGGLVVIGHSLSKDCDQHIVDALSNGNFESIAVGVWPHQDKTDVDLFKARVQHGLAEKTVYFFDSTTHPLGGSELGKGLPEWQGSEFSGRLAP